MAGIPAGNVLVDVEHRRRISDAARANDTSRIMPNTAQSLIHVLVIEDEAKLRDSLVEGLRLEDWAVTGVGTDAEAWHQLATQDFDVIILDWMLPDGDGIDLLRRLRAFEKTTPVLMMSARGGATVKDVVLQAGATAFLAKPFSFHDLLHAVRTLLHLAP